MEDEVMFSPEHLAFLVHLDLIPNIFVVGPIVDIFAFGNAQDGGQYAEDLVTWGVLTPDHDFTPAGRALFTGIYQFDSAIWGVLYLHNQKQPFSIELSEELIEWGLDKTLTDTPKVFWQISVAFGLVYILVRAGDRVSLTAVPEKETAAREMSKALLNVLDPEHDFSPVAGPGISFPATEFMENEVSFEPGKDSAKQERDLRKALKDLSVPAAWIDRYIELQKIEHLASTTINYSTTSENVSEASARISFILDKGTQIAYVKQGIDQIYRIHFDPASPEKVEQAINTLAKSKMTQRPGLSVLTH